VGRMASPPARNAGLLIAGSTNSFCKSANNLNACHQISKAATTNLRRPGDIDCLNYLHVDDEHGSLAPVVVVGRPHGSG
jgi:hypothetical protein